MVRDHQRGTDAFWLKRASKLRSWLRLNKSPQIFTHYSQSSHTHGERERHTHSEAVQQPDTVCTQKPFAAPRRVLLSGELLSHNLVQTEIKYRCAAEGWVFGDCQLTAQQVLYIKYNFPAEETPRHVNYSAAASSNELPHTLCSHKVAKTVQQFHIMFPEMSPDNWLKHFSKASYEEKIRADNVSLGSSKNKY